MNFALRRRPVVRRRHQVQRRRRRRFRAPARRARNARTGGYKGIELKFLDTELVTEAFTTGWVPKNPTTPNCLTAIELGTSESKRSGRKVAIHGIYIKGTIDLDPAEGATAPYPESLARICLVLDTQTNGAEMAATSVMEVPNESIFSFRKLENTARFKVLWDRTFKLAAHLVNDGATNAFSRGGDRRVFKINRNFKPPLTVQYTNTASPPTIAQVNDNSLHMIGVASTATATLSYNCRVRFTD